MMRLSVRQITHSIASLSSVIPPGVVVGAAVSPVRGVRGVSLNEGESGGNE